MPQAPGILAALDVGNHRILVLIGELGGGGELVIRGVGTAPSIGVKNGQIVQLKPVIAAIKAAVEEAEVMAKLPVEKVHVSVAGAFLGGRTTRAAIALGGREREVVWRDVDMLHDALRRQALPTGHIVLNVATPTYAVDDQDGVLDPVGMVGRHLQIDAYVIASQESPVRTLEKAVNEAGLVVEEFLFSPLAAAQATLTDDERRLGAILIDIGFANTTFAAYSGDKLLAAGCFPLGGNKLNDDLVHRFQTTTAAAERVKCDAGTVLLTDVGEDETLQVATIDGRSSHIIGRREMCKILRIRMQETFELIGAEVFRQIPPEAPCTGVVLSGGGAHLEGLVAVAEEVFGKRARLAETEGVADATHLLNTSEVPSRSSAVAIGLLVQARAAALEIGVPQPRLRRHRAGWIERLQQRFSKNPGGGS